MYKFCKTEQSAARQRELEQGLLQVMSTLRYEDINVSDLCQKMGIPRKSFYRYFSSKDGALHALIDHTLMEYESFGGNRITRVSRTLHGDLKSFFEFWIQHEKLLNALERSSMSGVLIERSISYAASEAVFPSRFLPGEDKSIRQHVVMFAVCGLMTMVLQWHHSGYQESASDMAMVAARLVTQPLFPNASHLL